MIIQYTPLGILLSIICTSGLAQDTAQNYDVILIDSMDELSYIEIMEVESMCEDSIYDEMIQNLEFIFITPCTVKINMPWDIIWDPWFPPIDIIIYEDPTTPASELDFLSKDSVENIPVRQVHAAQFFKMDHNNCRMFITRKEQNNPLNEQNAASFPTEFIQPRRLIYGKTENISSSN